MKSRRHHQEKMKFPLFLSILSLLLIFVFAGDDEPTNDTSRGGNRYRRLYYGKNATITSHPYFVTIEHKGKPICGGAMVSAHHVLTAAHCNQWSPSSLLVRAGSSLRGQEGSLHPVDTFESHPEYALNVSSGIHNDLAVIRVKVPFVLDQTRQPIGLFNAGEPIVADTKVVIVGLGDVGPRVRAEQLQKITIPVVGKTRCNEYYERFGGTPQGTFCAGFENGGLQATCVGDSGAPVTVDGRLAGIVSYGIGCALPKTPGVNTEVQAFRVWIDSKVVIEENLTT